MHGFLSDSCNGMKDVRKKLQQKIVKWEYGCVTHCLHNFSSDISSLKSHKATIKKALYVSKSVKNIGMARKIFDELCKEKLGKVYTMKLFSPTRWTTCNLMLTRLIKVRSALTLIPHTILNECEARKIDPDFVLPPKLNQVLQDQDFWNGVQSMVKIFDPISICIGFIESDRSTMSDVYASFIYVRSVLKHSSLEPEEKIFHGREITL